MCWRVSNTFLITWSLIPQGGQYDRQCNKIDVVCQLSTCNDCSSLIVLESVWEVLLKVFQLLFKRWFELSRTSPELRNNCTALQNFSGKTSKRSFNTKLSWQMEQRRGNCPLGWTCKKVVQDQGLYRKFSSIAIQGRYMCWYKYGSKQYVVGNSMCIWKRHREKAFYSASAFREESRSQATSHYKSERGPNRQLPSLLRSQIINFLVVMKIMKGVSD